MATKIAGVPIHASITLDRVLEMAERDLEGICIQCGEDYRPIEPDARHAHCDSCGTNNVYGAEELLLLMA